MMVVYGDLVVVCIIFDEVLVVFGDDFWVMVVEGFVEVLI